MAKKAVNITKGNTYLRDLTTNEEYAARPEQVYGRWTMDGKHFGNVDLTVIGPLAFNTRTVTRQVEILKESWVGKNGPDTV